VFHHAGLDVRELRKVIGSFSSSVTESRLSSKQIGPARPLREVKIDTSRKSFEMNQTYDAKIWDPPSDVNSTDWELRGDFKVGICDTAFGAGGERNAFLMRFLSGSEETKAGLFVAKEDKREATGAEETTFHKQKLVAQKYSKRMAEVFNSEIARLSSQPGAAPRLTFPTSYLLQTTGGPGEVRYLFVEQYIEGKLVKWNSNSGFVRSSKTAALDAIFEDEEDEDEDEDGDENENDRGGGIFAVDDVPQAFSHWSHLNSQKHFGESFLICDLQGFYNASRRTYELIDPVLHSGVRETTYARTDHGPKGVDKFYATHCCNNLCRRLRLPAVRATVESAAAQQDSGSVPTSAIPINKTMHLQQRQAERGIETKELQRAVKRGEKEVVREGKIKHTHDGVAYITDGLGTMGITGFKLQGGSGGGGGGRR
jgi:hypothetical protein